MNVGLLLCVARFSALSDYIQYNTQCNYLVDFDIMNNHAIIDFLSNRPKVIL